MKYVCSQSSYPNCPVHEGTSHYGDLVFFLSFKEYVDRVIEDVNEYEYGSLYSCKSGNEIISNSKSAESHRFTVIKFHVRNKVFQYRLLDDGHGNKNWVKQ